MINKFLGEIVISVLLIGLLIFFIDPFDILMPRALHPFMVPFLVILFIIFTAFLWKENRGDEREELHKFIASRFAYFAGILVLIVGIIVQSGYGKVDPFLILAICVMLLGKIAGIIYGHLRH